MNLKQIFMLTFCGHKLRVCLTVYLQRHGHAHCPSAIFCRTAVGSALLKRDTVDEEMRRDVTG